LTKKKKIFISFCIAAVIVTSQFILDRQEHLRLEKNGVITNAPSRYIDRAPGYAHFSFVTKKGDTLKETKKCGGKKGFDEEYSNMKVVYNAQNPKEFQTYYDFNSYSLTFRIIFFFFIYLIFLTFFLLIMDRNIRGLYNFFKGSLRSHRLLTTLIRIAESP